MEVESVADRLSGVAVEIEAENQGACRAREQEVPGSITESKAWYLHPVHLISFNPFHRFTLLSGNIHQGTEGF